MKKTRTIVCITALLTVLSLLSSAQNKQLVLSLDYQNKPLRDIAVIVQVDRGSQLILDTVLLTGFGGSASLGLSPGKDTLNVHLSLADCYGGTLAKEIEVHANSPSQSSVALEYCALRTQCWDLNGNDLCDFTSEDRNMDGFCDSIDCSYQCDPRFDYQSNGRSLSFINTSSALNSTSSFIWSFGDGSSSNLASPVHSFSIDSTYTVCLERIDSLCTSQPLKNCKQVVVGSDSSCRPSFFYRADLTNNLIFFRNASKGGSGNLKYQWDFGDGTVSSLPNPVKVFTNSGVYNVCLEQKASNCTNTFCDSVRVSITAYPCEESGFTLADFIDNRQYHVELKSKLDAHWMDYDWDFGNGTNFNGTAAITTYAFPGPYTACQSIYSRIEHCRDSSCAVIAVPDSSKYCNSDFSFQRSGLLKFDFSNASKNINASFRYIWNFGDNTSSTAENPIHTFPSFGLNKTFNVCLRIAGNDPAGLGLDCSDAICQGVFVNSEQKHEKDLLNIYPNPSTGTIFANIPIEYRNASLIIKDLNARVIMRRVVTGSNIEKIDISELPSGAYMLEFVSEEYSQALIFIRE